MKTSRAFTLATAALIIGFFTARWCAAQPSNQPPAKEPTSYDFGAVQQLYSFVSYLQQTGQTNILQRFNDYLNATQASQQYADLGVTAHILYMMRTGQTELAYNVLEGQLNVNIAGFAAAYRQLPASLRDQSNLTALKDAKFYRLKYPFQPDSQLEASELANAFKLLDAK
jgi:hypothetical protein